MASRRSFSLVVACCFFSSTKHRKLLKSDENREFYLFVHSRFHFVALTLLFLISLLIIFKAPTGKLWLLAVIASEYSIIFAGVTILFLSTNLYVASHTFLGTIIGLTALVIFLSPIVRAYFIGQTLEHNLEKAFRSTKNTTFAYDQKLVNEPFTAYKILRSISKTSFRTLTYIMYNDLTLTLDFYKSIVPGKRPCLIVIHGGSWNSGNSKQLPELNSYLAQAGYHCAAINYRLAPHWNCPAPIEDVDAAITYLRQQADELNIDADNFVLFGRSAGGQVALLAAYTLQQLCIRGVIDLYGPADMIWGYMTPTNPLVMNSREVLAKYIGGHYPQMPDKYVASSPIEFVNEQTVPTLIFHGQIDALVFDEHSRRLASKLEQHGIPHYFLGLPWATHGFDYSLNGPGGQLSTYAIHYFLNVVTRQQ